MEAVIEKIQFEKYPVYKDTGVKWLGEIPKHWEMWKLGNLLKPVSEKNRADLTLLSITREKGVIERNLDDENENHNFIPDDLSGYKILKKGQFGMNKMKAWQGSYGVSNYTGIVSPAYYVFDFSFEVDTDFFNIAIRSKKYVSFFGSASDGVRIGQWDLSKSRMKQIPVILPPKEEQTAIAQFLDDKCGKIDTAIAQKQQLIELLKERKQIIIQNAVTKGLNPNVKMKDSGVEWIGEVPEHWEVTKLGYLSYKIGDGLHGTPNYTDNSEYFFINGNNLGNKKINITEATKTVSYKEFTVHQKDLNINTVLLSINGTIGNVALYHQEKVMLGKSAAYINLLPSINRVYLANYLESRIFKNYYELELSGSTINNLSLFSIGKTPIVLPPDEEQEQIIKYIDVEILKIVNSIDLQQQQIEKLKEYKSSLIDAAVTGKIKVS